jgi:hypothetical protein
MTRPLKKGDIVIATHSHGLPDNVTEGREYRITHVWQGYFRIVNDVGIDIMPIETRFTLKEATQ